MPKTKDIYDSITIIHLPIAESKEKLKPKEKEKIKGKEARNGQLPTRSTVGSDNWVTVIRRIFMVRHIPRRIRFGIFNVFTDRRLSEDELISCDFNVRRLIKILINKEKESFYNNNSTKRVFVAPILPEHRIISVTPDYRERRAEACF